MNDIYIVLCIHIYNAYIFSFKVQELFIRDYGEIFNVQLPGKEERTKFFEDLILKQAAKPPLSKKKAG